MLLHFFGAVLAMSNGMGASQSRSCSDDRRGALRYKLNWAVRVVAKNRLDDHNGEVSTLHDLSSTGALAYLNRHFELGERVFVFVRLPFKKESWMTYSATVVRVVQQAIGTGVALKFDTARPAFTKSPLDSRHHHDFPLGT